MDTRKYIFENGVMKLNPNYKSSTNTPPTTVAAPNQALAIVSSTQDIAAATQAQTQATGRPMQLSEATTASMEIMQDQDFLNKFQTSKPMDGGDVLDGLSNIFARYEVPIGLVNKLLALTEYKLGFVVDDSGSMTLESDALLSQASNQMKQRIDAQGMRPPSTTMTRWQEAEDRLHVMVDMLAYIPTNVITIRFLNRSDTISLAHQGKTPEQFAHEAHQKIAQAFSKSPSGGTPVYTRLSEAFGNSSGATMHYLLTDGVPNDRSVEDVKKLVMTRSNPQMNPLTFMSCTNEDSEADWMKEIEEAAPYVAELDDFEDEKREVLKDQGPAFPYSKGFWLLCQLVAAINPTDLDAIDESVPFSKQTMDNLMGRKITPEEYRNYFQTNPNSQKYAHLMNEFMREDVSARDILARHNMLPSHWNQHGGAQSMQSQQHNNPPPYSQPNTMPNFPNANANNQGFGNTGYNPGLWQQPPQQQPQYQQQPQSQQYQQQQQQQSQQYQQQQQQQPYAPQRPGFGR